jgi:hypothetical protein
MAEEARQRQDNEWWGSPLQMWSGMDPHGISEIAVQFDTGDEEVLKPKAREEFKAYELNQTSTYLSTLTSKLKENRK